MPGVFDNLKGKFTGFMSQTDQEEIDDFYNNTDYAEEEDAPAEQEPAENNEQADTGESPNNVININDDHNIQFVLFKPETFSEAPDIANELMKHNTVILNFEDTNKDEARRISDFLAGVAYAVSGKVKKVATDTLIVMPSNVSLTGDDVINEVGTDNIYF